MIKSILLGILNLFTSFFKKRAQKASDDFSKYIFQVRSQSGPLKIELVSANDVSWLEKPEVAEIVRSLSDSGFETAGVWSPKGNPKTVLAGYASPQNKAWAEIFQGGGGKIYLSLSSVYVDGSAFEVTNMPVSFEPPTPKWMARKRIVGANFQQLWNHFLSARPDKLKWPPKFRPGAKLVFSRSAKSERKQIDETKT